MYMDSKRPAYEDFKCTVTAVVICSCELLLGLFIVFA